MTRRRGRIATLLLAGLLGGGSSCSSTVGGSDGESHFLVTCDGGCGADLECLCGVCSKPCASDATCRALSDGAWCGPAGSCGSGVRSCDVPCTDNSACQALGNGFACQDGHCREGSHDAGGDRQPTDAREDHSTSATPAPDDGGVEAGVPTRESGVPLPLVESGVPTHDGTSPFLDWDGGVVQGRDGAVSACCYPGTIEWRREGNPGADRHQLDGCNDYERSHLVGTVDCRSELPSCGGEGVTPFDVAQAMNDDAVRTAVRGAPVSFGQGTSLEVLTIDGREITIRAACAGAIGCVDVPAAVQRLLDVLHAVEGQQLGRGDCRPDSACYLPLDPGPCTGSFPRYAYDPATGGCVTFAYGGCQGNGNRFETEAACVSACDFDACLLGTYVDLEGGTCAPEVPVALGRGACFADFSAACACACSTVGLDASNCRITSVVSCP